MRIGICGEIREIREISLYSKRKCSLAEKEREDVEKKVGEAVNENWGFARKSAKFCFKIFV
jgi:hypothetical protein